MRVSRWVSLAVATWLVSACSGSESPGAGGGGGAGSAGVAGGAGIAGGGSSSGGTSGVAGMAGAVTGGTSPQGGAAQGGQSGQSGAAGTAATGGKYPGLPPFGPAPEDKPDTIEVGVRNNCPFPIWIHAEAKQGSLMPDYRQLNKGDLYWYDAPKLWESGRVTAYGDADHQEELDKVELTLDQQHILNYNVTYVDWVTLPVEMIARGSGDCKQVGCYVPESVILSGCPDGLLDGKRCQSARSYCFAGRNDDKPYCHALDSEVQRCATTKAGCEGAAGNNTANAYVCDGFFKENPKWCAALNRGTLDDPDNKDSSTFYKNPPFNTYAKWVHETCPGIYGFAYDDYPPNAEASGFHACNDGQELEITFCPSG